MSIVRLVLLSVADVKITMTLGDHDSTGLRLVFLSVADVKITMTFTTSKI